MYPSSQIHSSRSSTQPSLSGFGVLLAGHVMGWHGRTGAFVGGLTGAFVGGLTGALVGGMTGAFVGGVTHLPSTLMYPLLQMHSSGSSTQPSFSVLGVLLAGHLIGWHGRTGAFVGGLTGALVGEHFLYGPGTQGPSAAETTPCGFRFAASQSVANKENRKMSSKSVERTTTYHQQKRSSAKNELHVCGCRLWLALAVCVFFCLDPIL
jgi:hypothetical protein